MVQHINPGPRMSQAVVHNGIAWLSGVVGQGATVAEQTADCLRQIDATLAELGSDKGQILQAIIWLADMADFAAMNTAWEAWAPQGRTPARATGEARLAAPQYRVEIIVTAAVSG